MKHLLASTLLSVALPATADEPVVEDASARQTGSTWSISVTLIHPDTGWDHYADGWEVLDPDGNSLGIRVLAHPHVNEQPFTRSKGNISIPDALDHVLIRAKDNVDGWGQTTYRLDLNRQQARGE